MRKPIFVLILIMLGTSVSNAQILNRLKKKLERKIEQRIEDKIVEKVDKKVDEKLDDVFQAPEEIQEKDESNTDSQADQSSRSSRQLEGLFGNSSPKRSSYDFKGQIKMKISSEKENPVLFNYYFNLSNEIYGMEILNDQNKPTTFMIFADDQIINFINSEGSKSTFVFPTGLGERMADKMQPEGEIDQSKLRKTGATKQILGYLCHEYVMKDDDIEVSSWVTKDLDIPYMNFSKSNDNHLQGYTLESNINKDGKITNVLVTKIDLNKILQVNTADYK